MTVILKVADLPKLCTFLLKVHREHYVMMYILFKVTSKATLSANSIKNFRTIVYFRITYVRPSLKSC